MEPYQLKIPFYGISTWFKLTYLACEINNQQPAIFLTFNQAELCQ